MNLREEFEAWFSAHPASRRYSAKLEKQVFDGRQVYQWFEVQLAYDAYRAGRILSGDGEGT